MSTRAVTSSPQSGPSSALQREGKFDHAVLNLRDELDAGEVLFRSLGFTVAPRGYHTLGSMNHAIVFNDNYLELVGINPASANPRKELLDWPVGLNGLVYGSGDIAATTARLQSQGLPSLEPKAFGRPVTIAGATAEARFRTVHLAREFFPAARLYFCQHLTPELVWHPSFMRHPNTAGAITRIIVAATDGPAQAAALARTVGVHIPAQPQVDFGGVRVDFTPPPQLATQYGANINLDGPLPRIVGISIGVQSIAALEKSVDPRWRGRLGRPGPRRRIVAAAQCFGAMIEFLEPM